MAETSSAAFDCATKNWNGSQQTATSSRLTGLLSELNNTKVASIERTQLIKNGNGVDEQFVLNHTTKRQSICRSPLDFDKVNLLASKTNRPIDTPFVCKQVDSNLSTISNQAIDLEQLDDRLVTHNQSSESKVRQPQRKDNIVFRLGFKLEACDSTGTWYPAKVVGINEEDRQVLIHFIRWSKKFDEWMCMASEQLRPLTKDDEYSEGESQKSFSVGKLVMASWSDNKKYPGKVLNVTSDGNYNILFLDGYRKKVKKSLVEQIPDDYQFNFNSQSDNLTTAIGGNSVLNSSLLPEINTQQTNGSSATTSTPILNATSSNQSIQLKSKKRANDHLIASKEFVITEDHNKFKCEVEHCNKSFRKEKLLNSHVKYYHPEVYQSEGFKQRRLDQERENVTYLDDSLSNDLSSFNSSRQTTINENSNTSWNSEITTQKATKSVAKKCKEPTDRPTASPINKSKLDNNSNDLTNNDQPQATNSSLQVNGEFDNLDFESKSQQQSTSNELKSQLSNQKPKKNRSSPKQKQTPIETNDLFKPNSSLNLSSSTINNRLSNQNDSISYASDSTIEDLSINLSFDSPLVISNSEISKKMKPKRGRAPGKRKIKEKIDSDYYFEDSNTVSTTKSFENKKIKDSSTPKRNQEKRKYRSKNVQNCLNKELLELKIKLQEKQQQRLNAGENPEDDDQPNLFFANTPSTSSASESALAESAEFGTDFHNYETKRKYRNTSTYSSFDRSAHSPTNSSYITPTFLNTPLLASNCPTPSRKSIELRDGFVFSANRDANSSNVSPLSLHALEKPIPNTILPFWDARYVRDIHESDDVDELVNCVCDFKEESGLMIQCENCLTWAHGSCFDIETEDKVPDSYVCYTCKNPKMVRESQRHTYDQEWLKKGKNPCFEFLIKQQSSNSVLQSTDSIKQMLITNQLLSILMDVSQMLRSLRYKINLVKENNVKEMKYWESHLDEELIAQAPINNDDKILDQNITQTEHEMIGDILNSDFSKNILDNVATDGDKCIPDDELNNDLDGATDLIDFITSPEKESDQKDLNNTFGLHHSTSNFTNSLANNRSPFALNIKSEPLELHSVSPIINNQPLQDEKIIKRPTLEDKLLEHINSVHLDLMKKLELVERKIAEIENECDLSKSDLNSLRCDLVEYKDTAKDLYQDLQNVQKFTTI